MILQGDTLPDDIYVKTLKLEEKMKREEKLKTKAAAIEQFLSPAELRAVSDAKDPDASNWQSAVPLEEYNSVLNKKEFRDAMNLRYGKDLKRIPSKCPCGQSFNMTHALNCKTGGFITMRHNRVRDFEAQLLTQICNDVEIEPPLQPLEGEIINGLTGVNAKPDVRARGFWREGQNAFFDVRITNTNSESQRHLTSEKIFTKHEREKKRQYNNRIMNVEHGTFTPLVFSVNGGMAKECLKFHKFVAEKIANKSGCRCENVLSIIKCKLSFLILRASIMCVRGSRLIKKYISMNTCKSINSFMTEVLLYRNQSIDLFYKSMDWFLYNKDIRCCSSTYTESLLLHVLKHNMDFFCFSFFSLYAFFSQIFTNHRAAGERRDYLLISVLPLPPASQTLRHYLGYCCTSAHTCSPNRTRNLWYMLFRIHSFFTCTGSCCC